MPVPSPLERIGNVLAERYILEELLARGGMGVLYLGRHLLTGRRVAVKVMRPDDDEVEATEAARFLREAQAAAALEHPNVVQIFDMGVDQGAWFLVMELLEGESLAAHLQREGPLGPARALEWMLPVMGALATAHDHGVVHRDVKPENIFLARRGPRVVPTLLDFGIAKQIEAATLTERGMAIGTPMYMSPEQVRGDAEIGGQTDVWSMGVVLHLCLTGELPFDGNTPANVLVKVLSEPAPRLTEVAPWLPTELAFAVDRALEPSLDSRYADMRAFARALVGAAAGHLPLAEDPDPIGLPEFRSWLNEQGTQPLLQPPPPADPFAEPEPPSRSGTRRSSNPPSVFPLLPGRWLWFAVAFTFVLVGLWVGWQQWREPVAVPDPSPATPAPAAASAPEPETPSAPPTDDEEATQAGPVGDAAAVSPPPSPRAGPAREPRRERRAVPRKKRRPKRPSPPPRPSPETAAPDDPFQIRREYRTP